GGAGRPDPAGRRRAAHRPGVPAGLDQRRRRARRRRQGHRLPALPHQGGAVPQRADACAGADVPGRAGGHARRPRGDPARPNRLRRVPAGGAGPGRPRRDHRRYRDPRRTGPHRGRGGRRADAAAGRDPPRLLRRPGRARAAAPREHRRGAGVQLRRDGDRIPGLRLLLAVLPARPRLRRPAAGADRPRRLRGAVRARAAAGRRPRRHRPVPDPAGPAGRGDRPAEVELRPAPPRTRRGRHTMERGPDMSAPTENTASAAGPPVDLYDPAFLTDPYRVYERLRARGRLVPAVLPGVEKEVWLVTHYEDARAVLSDKRMLNDPTPLASAEGGADNLRLRMLEASGLPREYARYLVDASILDMDAPDHTRIRKHVSRAFTVRRVNALRPRVEEITDGLLDALPEHAEDGVVDLIEHFAYPLPITVICELVGVPEEQRSAW